MISLPLQRNLDCRSGRSRSAEFGQKQGLDKGPDGIDWRQKEDYITPKRLNEIPEVEDGCSKKDRNRNIDVDPYFYWRRRSLGHFWRQLDPGCDMGDHNGRGGWRHYQGKDLLRKDVLTAFQGRNGYGFREGGTHG